MKDTTFESLELIPSLLQALAEEGYTHPTPIQQQAIPHVLAGRDLLACAQTGTGKTAAFALPILQILSEQAVTPGKAPIRCLILTPTRELAAQIGESFDRYGKNLGVSGAVIFGGVGQASQVNHLRRGIDILVATPGRLLDLMEQNFVDLNGLTHFVLDEADRMLDMGFVHDVKRVIKVLPKVRQSLFFSATMPPDIIRLADTILTNPVKVEVTPVATTAEKIEQTVYLIEGQDGKRALLAHLIEFENIQRALVFTRTKHGADRVARFLNARKIKAEAIHGNKSQNNRVRTLDNFKRGDIQILVATDIAARGIDIDNVSHVINFEIPNVPETYVHRIGRTARAGMEGKSISLCDSSERDFLRDIEKLIRKKILTVPTPELKIETSREAPRPPRQAQGRGQPSARPTRGQGQGSARPTQRRGQSSARPAQGRGQSSARPNQERQNRSNRQQSTHQQRPRKRRPNEDTGSGPLSKGTSTEKTSWWKRLIGVKE